MTTAGPAMTSQVSSHDNVVEPHRLKALAPLMGAALRWLASATPGSAELLRLMDATPVPCGHSVVTAKRSDLYGYAGYGYCPSHSRWYWGSKLLIICTCDGTVTGFGLANPKLYGEREQARQILERQPANRPAPGTAVVTDKGLSGEDFEEFLSGQDLGLALIRPARKDEKQPRYFPNWLRQRVEAVIWTLKPSSASNATAAASPPGYGPASSSGCWPSTPASSTTGSSAHPSNAP
jgi:Transposase DDE domain